MKGAFMATRKDTTTRSDPTAERSATSATDTMEERVVAFAEQLGRIIGSVQAKTDGWLDRQTLNDQLTRIRDAAADLLQHLGSGTAAPSVAATAAPKGPRNTPKRSATAKMAQRATPATARRGGKVGAPGKSHRKPQAATRGIQHSDETIPKWQAAQRRRRNRRG